MDIVYVLMILEDEEREVYGIYKTWSGACDVAKTLENQEKYDSVEIEEWSVQQEIMIEVVYNEQKIVESEDLL